MGWDGRWWGSRHVKMSSLCNGYKRAEWMELSRFSIISSSVYLTQRSLPGAFSSGTHTFARNGGWNGGFTVGTAERQVSEAASRAKGRGYPGAGLFTGQLLQSGGAQGGGSQRWRAGGAERAGTVSSCLRAGSGAAARAAPRRRPRLTAMAQLKRLRIGRMARSRSGDLSIA